jgi:CHAD domain-containing protein
MIAVAGRVGSMNIKLLSAPSTVGSYAQGVIQHEFERVVKQEKAVLDDLDLEPLHKMRVGMRRLRAAFNTFSPVIALPKQGTIQVIAKVSKQLGATRDWDVMQRALKEDYRPLLSNTEQDQLDKTLLQLKKHRKHSFKHLQKTLTGNDYDTLKRSLHAWLDHPTFESIAELPVDWVLPDLLLPTTSQLLLHPGWWVVPAEFSSSNRLKTLNIELSIEQTPNSKVLHDLRKRVKEIRYQSEFFQFFYSPTYGDYIETLKAIQEILGQLQDCTVLGEFLITELTSPLSEVLPTVAQQFQCLKQQAWENWQPLRQCFTDPEYRQALRSQLLHPCNPASETVS